MRLCVELTGGEWAGQLEAMYEDVKLEFGYLLPKAEADRRSLRGLCLRTPDGKGRLLGRAVCCPATAAG